MKIVLLYFSLIFGLLINTACQNEVVLSQQSENSQKKNKNQISKIEKQTQTPQTDDKDKFYIENLVSEKKFFNYQGYKIRQFLTKKKYDDDAPIADIADAVLEKNGKQILKFEGVYYPLGNQIQIGLYSLTDVTRFCFFHHQDTKNTKT